MCLPCFASISWQCMFSTHVQHAGMPQNKFVHALQSIKQHPTVKCHDCNFFFFFRNKKTINDIILHSNQPRESKGNKGEMQKERGWVNWHLYQEQKIITPLHKLKCTPTSPKASLIESWHIFVTYTWWNLYIMLTHNFYNNGLDNHLKVFHKQIPF